MIIEPYRNPVQPAWKSLFSPFLFYGIRRGSASDGEVRPTLDLAELDRLTGRVAAM